MCVVVVVFYGDVFEGVLAGSTLSGSEKVGGLGGRASGSGKIAAAYLVSFPPYLRRLLDPSGLRHTSAAPFSLPS